MEELNFNLGEEIAALNNRGGFVESIKLGDGDTILQIMPPVKKGHALSHKWEIHWGFVGPSGKDTPLVCSGFNCPICAHAKKLKEQFETLAKPYSTVENNQVKINFDAWKAQDAAGLERYKQIKEIHDKIKVQIKFAFAAFKQGDSAVKVLQVTKSVRDELLGAPATKYRPAVASLLLKIQALGIQPVSLTNGVWLKVNKTGQGMSTRYKVDASKKLVNLNGMMAETYDVGPIPEAVAEAYKAKPIDLAAMYKSRTAAQLAKILAGDASGWDEGDSKAPEFSAEPVEAAPTQTVTAPAPVTQPAPVAPAAPVAATQPTRSNADEEKLAKLRAELGL